MFSNSKFILNVRQLNTWVYSRLSHIDRQKVEDPNFICWPTWDNTTFAIKSWIKERNEHHAKVLQHFARRPSDLLIVNFVRDESAATKICNHLGFTGECERPSKNVSSRGEVSPLHRAMLDECVADLGLDDVELDYDILCPSLLDEKLLGKFPSDTALIVSNRARTQEP